MKCDEFRGEFCQKCGEMRQFFFRIHRISYNILQQKSGADFF